MKPNEFAIQIIKTLLAKSQPQYPGALARTAWVSKKQAQCLPPRPWSWAGEIDGVPVEVSIEDLNYATKLHWLPRQCDVEVRVCRNILLERGVTPPPGTFVDPCPVRYGAPPIDDRYK